VYRHFAASAHDRNWHKAAQIDVRFNVGYRGRSGNVANETDPSFVTRCGPRLPKRNQVADIVLYAYRDERGLSVLQDENPTMRRFALITAALVAILGPAQFDRAMALPLGSSPQTATVLDEVTCRPPPWYRGWAESAPWVCAHYWWWPRYYYRGLGVHHRRHHEDP
jgi:hypothetical protein